MIITGILSHHKIKANRPIYISSGIKAGPDSEAVYDVSACPVRWDGPVDLEGEVGVAIPDPPTREVADCRLENCKQRRRNSQRCDLHAVKDRLHTRIPSMWMALDLTWGRGRWPCGTLQSALTGCTQYHLEKSIKLIQEHFHHQLQQRQSTIKVKN